MNWTVIARGGTLNFPPDNTMCDTIALSGAEHVLWFNDGIWYSADKKKRPAFTTPTHWRVRPEELTLENAPVGSILLIGHEANGVTARLWLNGKWYYTHTNFSVEVDYDDLHKASRLIYVPGVTHR